MIDTAIGIVAAALLLLLSAPSAAVLGLAATLVYGAILGGLYRARSSVHSSPVTRVRIWLVGLLLGLQLLAMPAAAAGAVQTDGWLAAGILVAAWIGMIGTRISIRASIPDTRLRA